MNQNRTFSFDILRIIAAFSVVMLHVSSRYMMICGVNDINGQVANLYDSLNRFGVPVFVMISGAIFLNPEKEIDVKRLWIHNILRIFIVYIIWSYAYYAYQSIYEWHFDFIHQGLTRTVTGIAYASDHLWYLGMLVGLYAMIPVLRSWLHKTSKQNIEYFLLLFIGSGILLNTVNILLNSSLVGRLIGTFRIAELSGYLGYFVLGYYLMNYEVPKNLRHAVYATVPLDITLNYLISWKFSIDGGAFHAGVYDSFGVFTFLEVIALFMAIVYGAKGAEPRLITKQIFRNIATDTFGVYLMHVMALDFIFSKGIISEAMPSALWQPIIAIGLFAVCSVIAALLRRIPVIGRYLC